MPAQIEKTIFGNYHPWYRNQNPKHLPSDYTASFNAIDDDEAISIVTV